MSTFTMTQCPEFDPRCKTGQVETRTLTPAKETANNNGGEDSAATMKLASRWVVLVFAAMAAFMNSF